jgi:hypothetical protein
MTNIKDEIEERFEKVVEWEREPLYKIGFIGFLIYGWSTASFIILLRSISSTPVMISIISITFTILSGCWVYGLGLCSGKGRKVYWRKIK